LDDDRIWHFERDLWIGGADVYRERVSDDVVMALPAQPFLYDAEGAIKAVTDTPRWESVDFAETRVHRPQEGLIVIAYHVVAKRGQESYRAACTSTLRRLSHEHWDVVQHSQMPFGLMIPEPAEA
jgi:hypothetical protein